MAPHGLCHWLLLATLGKAYFLIRTRSSSRVICCHSHTRVKSNAAPPLVTTAVKEWQPHCGFSMLGSRDYSKDMFIWPVFRMGELQEDCQMFATTAFFCGVGCAVDTCSFFSFLANLGFAKGFYYSHCIHFSRSQSCFVYSRLRRKEHHWEGSSGSPHPWERDMFSLRSGWSRYPH